MMDNNKSSICDQFFWNNNFDAIFVCLLQALRIVIPCLPRETIRRVKMPHSYSSRCLHNVEGNQLFASEDVEERKELLEKQAKRHKNCHQKFNNDKLRVRQREGTAGLTCYPK